jgi:zinc/manganese transport system substrate-binding protein
MRTRLFWLMIVLMLAISATPAIAQEEEHEHDLHVVVTYSILGDFVRNVVGDDDHIEITVLVGPDGDAHTYEPTPSDAEAMLEADVIFENGLLFETWLDDLYEASGSEALRVVAALGIVPLEFEGEHGHEHEGEAEHSEDEEHDHEHGEFDPHIWHDPNNAIIMVENVRDALMTLDPDHAPLFQTNAAAYIAELQALDTFIREQVANIPEAQRILFTSHDTFGYFAQQYGFGVDSALGALTTEVADPSAGELAELITEIQESGVPSIFAENIANPDLMQQIADNAGVMLAPTLYTDALGAEGTPGATYLEMVRYNVTTIVEALSS